MKFQLSLLVALFLIAFTMSMEDDYDTYYENAMAKRETEIAEMRENIKGLYAISSYKSKIAFDDFEYCFVNFGDYYDVANEYKFYEKCFAELKKISENSPKVKFENDDIYEADISDMEHYRAMQKERYKNKLANSKYGENQAQDTEFKMTNKHVADLNDILNENHIGAPSEMYGLDYKFDHLDASENKFEEDLAFEDQLDAVKKQSEQEYLRYRDEQHELDIRQEDYYYNESLFTNDERQIVLTEKEIKEQKVNDTFEAHLNDNFELKQIPEESRADVVEDAKKIMMKEDMKEYVILKVYMDESIHAAVEKYNKTIKATHGAMDYDYEDECDQNEVEWGNYSDSESAGGEEE